jgi:hypothetical protein
MALLLVLAAAVTVRAQDVTVEYRMKAAYLYNFVRFVEWPGDVDSEPLTICVAGRNPFGEVLDETVRGELVNGRPVATRIILEPESGCDVIFVPQGAAATAYLRDARNKPILTVGENIDFIALGGMIALQHEDPDVRFTINPDAAERAGLRISSRLLQLARIANDKGETR